MRATLAVFVLLPPLLIGAGCSGTRNETPAPRARAGLLDLRTWDFDRNGPTPLNGEWEFYWKQLRTFDSDPGVNAPPARGPGAGPGSLAPVGPSFIEVPSYWDRAPLPGQEPTRRGYATYRLRVQMPPDDGNAFALYIPQQRTSYRVFVNGREAAAAGTVGTTADETRAAYETSTVRLTPRDTNEIVVQVANFEYRHGGLDHALILGLDTQINTMRQKTRDLYLFLGGVVTIMGLYHLVLFALRRKNPATLFFGLYSLMIVCWMAFTVGERYLLAGTTLPFWLTIRIGYGSVFLALLFFARFMGSVFPDEFHSTVTRFFELFVGLLLVCGIVLPTFYFTFTMPAFYAVTILGSFYALLTVVRAWRRKRPGAGIFLIGLLALVLGNFQDALFQQLLIQSQFVTPIALLIFLFAQAAMLARRFANAFDRVESLSSELETRNKELDQKNRDLARLDELKDDFLANTSHELRTPLNGIIGITDSILEGATGGVNEKTGYNLRMVSASGRRLANLVNDILDFSRLRHEDIALRKSPVDVSPLIEIVLAISKPLVGEKEIQLIHSRHELPLVFADEDRLEQILLNLVGNAIKFTKRGEVRVEARQVQASSDGNEANGGFLEISVSDTGIGIPPEQHDRIFESFTQADGSISREYGGTGIGLSVTKRLVELHGGKVRLESSPGQGSVFFFTIPLAQAEPATGQGLPSGSGPAESQTRTIIQNEPGVVTAAAVGSKIISAPVTEREAKTSSRAKAEREPCRILIVDDDPVNLQVLENNLSLEDHHVIRASSGQMALELFDRGERFDLVLLDVMMPGLSGYEVCRLLRETYSQTELPVIMLTAKNRVTDLVAGLESGANDYLAKPFDTRELLARVETMLRLKDAARAQSALAQLNSEMELAHTLQRSLLPRSIPQPAGLTLTARYRSMTRVGGDFYDFRAGPEGMGAFIADVSGHGVAAALIVSVVKMAFWFQKGNLHSPTLLFGSMNEILMGNIGGEFVSAAYFFVDVKKKQLIVGNAGHPPVLVWKRGRHELQPIRPRGRLLGVLVNAAFDSQEIPLDSGDRIIAYTDGVYEARNAFDEQFGEARFHEFIEQHANLDGPTFADLLLQTIIDWSGGESEIDDDIAFFLVDVL